MNIENGLLSGSWSLLVLKTLEKEDMYGYQIIENLAIKSDDTFSLKAGTLYPLLKTLEQQGVLNSYEKIADNKRKRIYYSITPKGQNALQQKQDEWSYFTAKVNELLNGGQECGVF